MSEQCIDKNILLFSKIFRHVALLFTEISHQDQNFKIIPRTYDNAIFIMVNEIKSNNFLARLCGDK